MGLLRRDKSCKRALAPGSNATVHKIAKYALLLFTRCSNSNLILPMLRILNRQNLLPLRYYTEFSVQKIPTCK